jgi:Helix-turn-helix domain
MTRAIPLQFVCALPLLNEFCVGDACQRLAETDRSIAQIMFEVGFLTKSNFNREFRRATGKSPQRLARRAEGPAGREADLTSAISRRSHRARTGTTSPPAPPLTARLPHVGEPGEGTREGAEAGTLLQWRFPLKMTGVDVERT